MTRKFENVPTAQLKAMLDSIIENYKMHAALPTTEARAISLAALETVIADVAAELATRN